MKKYTSRRDVLVGTAALTAVLTPLATAAHGSKVHDVQIKSFKFDPAHLQVSPGDTIRWTNKDVVPHTATADEYGWDTGALGKDEAGEIVVTEGMETSYFCVFHPNMKGTIEIV